MSNDLYIAGRNIKDIRIGDEFEVLDMDGDSLDSIDVGEMFYVDDCHSDWIIFNDNRGHSKLQLFADCAKEHYSDIIRWITEEEESNKPQVKLNKTKRKKAAKQVRQLEQELEEMLEKLQSENGFDIDYQIEINISYQEPKEEY